MTAKVFEAALGIAEPWAVAGVEFDELAKTLTVVIDFKRGSRFEVSGHAGRHPIHPSSDFLISARERRAKQETRLALLSCR